MSLLNYRKKTNKETISLYQKECKRLEKERNELLAELNAIKGYKQQYEDLIDEVTQLKNRYEVLIGQTEAISTEYKEKLEEALK